MIARDCPASDQCHVAGTCSPATGVCSDPVAPDGTACSDGDLCTQGDACQSGTCTGANPVVCTASDQCHVAGVCDPGTGTCSNPSVPTARPVTTATACSRPTPARRACARGQPRGLHGLRPVPRRRRLRSRHRHVLEPERPNGSAVTTATPARRPMPARRACARAPTPWFARPPTSATTPASATRHRACSNPERPRLGLRRWGSMHRRRPLPGGSLRRRRSVACCTPGTCQAGQCGEVPDGCGGTLSCDCPSGQSCGGGGTPNVCGCTPTCADKCPGEPDCCGGSCPVPAV